MKMNKSQINEVLEKIHQSEGLPRLEIEGGKYPVNEEAFKAYHVCNKDSKQGTILLETDGFGGQVGSVNVESGYLRYLKTRRGNRCVYVLKDKWERPDNYTTVIDREYILFKKSDLVRVIENALKSNDKKAEMIVLGKRIADDVIWEDSMPTGPCFRGPKVMNVSINLQINLNIGEQTYRILFQKMKLYGFCSISVRSLLFFVQFLTKGRQLWPFKE